MENSFLYRIQWVLLSVSLQGGALAQNIGINTNGSSPNASALLDVDNNGTLRGVLLTRLSSTDRLSIAGLGATEDGLTVYDTTTKTYWYWDGTQWVEIGTSAGGSGWLLTGNAGTVNGTHFLGTTDFAPLSFRVNSEHAGRIEVGFWANVFLGHEAGLNNVGQGNVALGARALDSGNSGWLNTALGISTLYSNTAGGLNTASGNSALFSNTTGSSNTAYGSNSLSANVAGSNATAIGTSAMAFTSDSPTPFENTNVAVGFEALRGSFLAGNNTGLQNTAVGYRAMTSNTAGEGNTALGRYALHYNTAGHLNTAMGISALMANTTGTGNTAGGVNAMLSNTSGGYNAAWGNGALLMNTTGMGNTSHGSGSMTANTVGNGNTALGANALTSNIAGSNATAVGIGALLFTNSTTIPFENTNVAVGHWALRGSFNPAVNTGLNNTAVGYQAMVNNTTGYENVAVGTHALDMNTTGWWCTALGFSSLANNVAGEGNTATGCLALNSNSTGNGNSAFGFQALATNTLGSYNTAIGRIALSANGTGWNNVGVGVGADCWNQSGSNNTIVGTSAGRGDVAHSKSGCVFLGHSAGYFELSSDRLYIDNSDTPAPLIYGEFDNDFVRINHNLGIGCSNFGGGTKVLAFEAGTAPGAPIPNGGLIFAQLQGGIHELRTMDGAGNVTTISPHNFSLATQSEPMAWSFYSENGSLDRRVNVDMMHLTRLVERMSGEQLVYMTDMDGATIPTQVRGTPPLAVRMVLMEEALVAAQEQIASLQLAVQNLRSQIANP